ncbi:hypothetical protein [Tenacibaculum mesophilum]|uniref:hypothetical protein n=1 Tax=Tenacibaculum mesophilum TaxID=104268 RepID=UPI0024927F6D|nr:hypothetical protein [Tenacibaculum mesophilum]
MSKLELKATKVAPKEIQLPNCLLPENKKTTLAVLYFSKQIIQDKISEEIFNAKDEEDCVSIASQAFTTLKIVDAIILLVDTTLTMKYSFDELFEILTHDYKYLDVIDVLQDLSKFSHLHYLQEIKSFEGDSFQQDYINFAKENKTVFTQLITAFQTTKAA